jgi:hypothetical protein
LSITAHELGMSKRFGTYLAMSGLGLVAAYGMFIGILSIRMGVYHADKDAFWVPILGGGCCILFSSWVCYRSAKYLRHRVKRSERLRI